MKRSWLQMWRSESGQVLPLAAISLLVLALVVMLSIGISYTVRNRIRLQNYADAKAYSTAVQEARALNYFAYTNRAIANAYVEASTMHAYMSMVSMMASFDFGAAEAFGEMVECELDLAAAAAAEWDFVEAAEHAWHAAEAGINAGMFAIDYLDGDLANKIQKLDTPFRNTMSVLNAHIIALHGSQEEIALAMGVFLAQETGGDQLTKNNMVGPHAAVPGYKPDSSVIAGGDNAVNFKNALVLSGNERNRRIEMTNVVNATRPPFTWDRNSPVGVLPTYLETVGIMLAPNGPINKQVVMDKGAYHGGLLESAVPNTVNIMASGRAGMSDGEFGGIGLGIFQSDAPNTSQGTAVVSYDTAEGATLHWQDCPGEAIGAPSALLPSPIATGEIRTDRNGGLHSGDDFMGSGLDIFSSPHSGGQHKLDWDTSRFMEYNISATDPYNQPIVFATAKADLRIGDDGQLKMHPWEINQTGVVKIDVGGGNGRGSVTMADTKKATAVSKAMVYYHRFGDWQEPPNLFNPYWRAKLEAWTETDILKIGAVDTEGALGVEAMQALGNKGAINVKN